MCSDPFFLPMLSVNTQSNHLYRARDSSRMFIKLLFEILKKRMGILHSMYETVIGETALNDTLERCNHIEAAVMGTKEPFISNNMPCGKAYIPLSVELGRFTT